MPNILINELSAVGQAPHAAAADGLMRELATTYKALEPILCGGALYSHSMLGGSQLTETMTVYGWLAQRHAGAMQVVRLLILDIINKRPKIDNWLRDHVPEHTCQHMTSVETTSRVFSALAGAAHMEGWLLSIRDCNAFPQGSVQVDYCEQGESLRPCRLEHFVVSADVTAKRRVYEPNEKHKTTSTQNSGVRIAAMDLRPEEAQRVLDCAQFIPNERRVFSLYGRKIYVFFEHTPQHYHGYLVENPREYQTRDAVIYNQLRDWRWVE
jgi:hypothetical protein